MDYGPFFSTRISEESYFDKCFRRLDEERETMVNQTMG